MLTLETLFSCVIVSIIFLTIFFGVLFILYKLANKRSENKHERKHNYKTHHTYISSAPKSSNSPDLVQNKKEYIGKVGELEVSSIIGESMPRIRYVFNDALIKLDDQISQIDHILVNRAGVFVIETKNYSGRICGDVNSDDWVQISRKGRRYTFYNPIMQNDSHVRIIRKIVGNDVKIFPLVVFVKSTPPFSVKNLIHISQLRKNLIDTSVSINLSSDEIMEVALKINSHISRSSYDRAKHLSETKNLQDTMRQIRMQKSSIVPPTTQKSEPINDKYCPRCHRELVLRKLPYCDYWECSGAPHCHYTKSID